MTVVWWLAGALGWLVLAAVASVLLGRRLRKVSAWYPSDEWDGDAR